MQSVAVRVPHVCTLCAKRLWQTHASDSLWRALRHYSQAATQQQTQGEQDGNRRGSIDESGSTSEKGAMSRRLEDMTEESIREGGRGARKSMADAGFSEELKEALLAKLEDGKFRSENPSAFTEVTMPVHEPSLAALRITDKTQRLVLAGKQGKQPQLNPGRGRRAWKMLLCACSMMHTSPSVVRVLVEG